jgi:hypothetical protein
VKEACSQCNFWKVHAKADRGDCRRYPPQIQPALLAQAMERERFHSGDYQTISTSDDVAQASVWPITKPDHGCGEFDWPVGRGPVI